jgi:putative PIN family toxin of toxin-antitoxin system
MRVVLDTNVLVSALISKGRPNKLLSAILLRGHSLILSDPIIEELSTITGNEKVARYADDEEYTAFLRTLLAKASFVQLKSKVRVFNDPDDLVLSTAKDGKADFIVTGDRHMLELKRFRGIRIITVDQALRLL